MKLQVFVLSLFNLVIFIVLLYMFDVFGVVDYYTLMRSRIEPNLPGFITKIYNKPRINDASALTQDDLKKMRESFILREKDISSQEQMLITRAVELNTEQETLQQDKDNLLLAWSNYQAKIDERSNYQAVLADLAGKLGSMPPQNSVALINELAAGGSDELVIDVLLEMDAIAAQAGGNSITSFLISLLDPAVAARLLEKYEKRTSPQSLEIPQSPQDFIQPNY
jgi:hypothetical protein